MVHFRIFVKIWPLAVVGILELSNIFGDQRPMHDASSPGASQVIPVLLTANAAVTLLSSLLSRDLVGGKWYFLKDILASQFLIRNF